MQNNEQSRKEVLKAGATILLGLAVLGMFIVGLGGHRFWESLHTYTIRFDSVLDLRPGRPVKYAGLNVGRVLEMDVDPEDPGFIRVRIGVESDFPLYEGTYATISQKGLVGDNYVLLELEGTPGTVLADEANLPGRLRPTMNDVAAKIGNMMDDLSPKLARIATKLESFVDDENSQNMKKLLAEAPAMVAQAKATLARIETDMKIVSESAVEGISHGRKSLSDVTAGLDTTLGKINESLEEVSGGWNETMGTIQTEVKRIGGSLDKVAAQLESGLDHDQEQLEQVLDNMNDMTRDLKHLSQSLRERPWQIIHKSEQRSPLQ